MFYSGKKFMKIAKFSVIRMTLTFDLEFIFKVKGQG
jgi:hypothetical protein